VFDTKVRMNHLSLSLSVSPRLPFIDCTRPQKEKIDSDELLLRKKYDLLES
jgi:hypothetical protein